MDVTLTELDRAVDRTAIDSAVMLPTGLICPNPWNRQIDVKRLADMTESVRKHGVLQPVLVRPLPDAKAGQPLYELIAGERRWRASQAAGLPTVPALVRQMDDLEVIELNLIENLQREGLHELDEAAGYERLLRRPDGLRGFATVEELAERIGRSVSYIKQRLVLLKLCPEGVLAFREGELSFSLALRIARLPNQADQREATKKILQGWGGNPMTARDADEYIQREFMLQLSKARFKISDATLVPDAGSCNDCSKRTGANRDLFGDAGKADTCIDGACYDRKEEAHIARMKAQAEAKGQEVISGAAAKKILPNSYGAPKGYLPLDEPLYSVNANKPLRQLLAKTDVKTTLVESPHTRELVELVDEKQVLAALKAAGLLKQAKLPKGSPADRKREDEAKRETAWRTAVAEDCLQQARGDAGATPEARGALVLAVALALWREMQHDMKVRVTKLLGWPPMKASWESGPGITAENHIVDLDDRELCRYLTACTIASETAVAAYQVIKAPEMLLATAARLGVDVGAAKQRVRELAKATPDAVAAKRATKKAATLTPETALAQALKTAEAAKPTKAPTQASSKARPVRYRCPQTLQTWSGRGLQPAWLKAALANGTTLASLAVNADAANGTAAADTSTTHQEQAA